METQHPPTGHPRPPARPFLKFISLHLDRIIARLDDTPSGRKHGALRLEKARLENRFVPSLPSPSHTAATQRPQQLTLWPEVQP